MQRKAFIHLINWSLQDTKKPLIIRGARSVGKTYLITDFASENYTSHIYFNFERDCSITHLFSSDIDKTIINLNQYFDKEINFKSTLLILDEIANCEPVIDFISQIGESETFNIACAISNSTLFQNSEFNSSLNDLLYDDRKFEIINLFPLDFEEFLISTNNEWYAEAIKEHYQSNKPLPEIVHNEILSIFNQYIYIGGMPMAINEYLQSKSLININEIHSVIINNQLMDIKQRISDGDYIKSETVYNSVKEQFRRPNKKFMYTILRKGATKKIYEKNLEILCKSGLTYKCSNYTKDESFVLYLNDVGLLNSMYCNQNTDEINKSIIENYVLVNLLTNNKYIYNWESKSQARIDFVIVNKNNEIYAVEVKNSNETRSKNYSIFKDAVPENNGLIKISAKNFSCSKGVKYIPLYAVFCI